MRVEPKRLLGRGLEEHAPGQPGFAALVRELEAGLDLCADVRADVDAAIRKYIDPDNVLVAVVTQNADALKAALIVARAMKAKRLILVTNVAGVLDHSGLEHRPDLARDRVSGVEFVYRLQGSDVGARTR